MFQVLELQVAFGLISDPEVRVFNGIQLLLLLDIGLGCLNDSLVWSFRAHILLESFAHCTLNVRFELVDTFSIVGFRWLASVPFCLLRQL